MNKPQKQTVYLPVKENGGYSIHWGKDKIFNHAIMKEGYFFTPEQLNEYTANVIKQALETAAEKAKTIDTYKTKWMGTHKLGFVEKDVYKESITNTFENTFEKFKV